MTLRLHPIVAKLALLGASVAVALGATELVLRLAPGLLSEEETTELRKLPILGQIPLIGALFTHRLAIKRKTNLIIEVKPKIIRKSSDLIFEAGGVKGDSGAVK